MKRFLLLALFFACTVSVQAAGTAQSGSAANAQEPWFMAPIREFFADVSDEPEVRLAEVRSQVFEFDGGPTETPPSLTEAAWGADTRQFWIRVTTHGTEKQLLEIFGPEGEEGPAGQPLYSRLLSDGKWQERYKGRVSAVRPLFDINQVPMQGVAAVVGMDGCQKVGPLLLPLDASTASSIADQAAGWIVNTPTRAGAMGTQVSLATSPTEASMTADISQGGSVFYRMSFEFAISDQQVALQTWTSVIPTMAGPKLTSGYLKLEHHFHSPRALKDAAEEEVFTFAESDS